MSTNHENTLTALTKRCDFTLTACAGINSLTISNVPGKTQIPDVLYHENLNTLIAMAHTAINNL